MRILLRKTIGYAAAIFLLSTFATSNVQPTEKYFTVSNLKYGLMREGADGKYRVYEEALHIPLVANGVCSVAGEFSPCVWSGLEFEYHASQEKTTLQCVQTRPIGDVVTSIEIVAEKVTEMSMEILIEPQSGSVSWPGYTALTGPKDAAGLHSFRCVYDGKVVIDLSWEEFRPDLSPNGESGELPKLDLGALRGESEVPVEALDQQ